MLRASYVASRNCRSTPASSVQKTCRLAGALSDFAYDISVTDTLGGTTKTYHNAAGSYCGGLDNNAFPP
jgi:hypothetical protein